MASTVELYDAADPGQPRLELAANFHPNRHVRWAFRPAVGAVDLDSIEGLSNTALEGLKGSVATYVDLVRVMGEKPSYLSAKAKQAIVKALAEDQGFRDAMAEPVVATDEETEPEDEPADDSTDAAADDGGDDEGSE